MKKNLTVKTLVIIAVMLVFLYGIIGIPKSWSRQGLADAIQQNIHLGLDLRGGTHLILQVMVNDAVNAETDRAVERVREGLRAKGVTAVDISKPDPVNQPEKIVVSNVAPDQTTTARNVLAETVPEYDIASGAGSFTVSMKPAAASDLKTRAIELAIQKIRERVDKLGVSEPVIQKHGLGENQILVQLPGVDDPARVKDIIQSTAMLEIRQAMDSTPYKSETEALQAHNGVLPQGAVLMHGRNVQSTAAEDSVFVISRASAVAGHDLREARSDKDETGRPQVSFLLTPDGGKRFAAFTRAHIGDSLAIVLDNRVIEVATIQSEISDSGRITGAFTEQQSKDLALVLNSGALPASMRYLEERTVGPSLGADSIRQGVTAGVIGVLAVMVFMLFYYRGAGINADLALLLNLIILLGFMGFAGAVLTLPGIAGVILTIGMGVDSNVLIFERIREELRNGKTAPSAVEQGFGRAWVTILDTHVTTMVSALILFLVGTGPVQGFATTLFFGLAANLFTAVFVSRVIFDAILNRKQRGEALSI
ncbi:MAG: protein translocase subunit SecD [Acidobacteriota bacterium]|nr:protein translocase subunit SecD [Acidobacteriota bacterium]